METNPDAETVLVVGATGNVGVSAVITALRSSRKVIAIVRNQTSADKLVRHVGSSSDIILVEADIMSKNGVKAVVDKVKKGELPAFQHVFSTAGGAYKSTTPLKDISSDELHQHITTDVASNFYAYRETIPYLLEQNNHHSTWTLCTGCQGDIALRAAAAITQGALFSMATSACRENAETNVRFNELYLAAHVQVDEVAAQTGSWPSSKFAAAYEKILASPEIRSSRIVVYNEGDVDELKYEDKFEVARARYLAGNPRPPRPI